MKLKPTYFLLILLAAIAAATAGCSHSAAVETPDYIARLDSLIDHSPDFERNKLRRLAELTQKRKNAVSTTDKYMLNSILFDEYHTYKSDSAIKYIDANIELALQSGNKDWLTESKIKKSEFLTGTGLLADAQNLMESIDRQDITPELLPAYYGNMIYLYSHLGNYTGGSVNEYYIKERAYKDSVMSVITPDHPEYLWYKGWDILGTAKPEEETIKSLKEKLSASNLNTHQDAKDAYILAKLYEQAGDRENYLRYMATSAAVDVKIANSSEISSLEDLSRIMFGKGDGNIDRAYRYINYCLNKAISYPNRVKAYGISSALDAISRGYEQRNIRHQQRIRNFLVLACVLAAILTAAIVIIIVQNGRLRRQGRDLDATNKTLGDNIRNLNETHQQLNEANTQLKQLIADLQQKNDELNEANFVKEEYICNIFTICSNYIDKLSELKKSIHVKVMKKKYIEIENETEDFDMKDELKEFYRSFDTVFLHIYPDFVNDFNSLLQEDKRITPKEGELLNTELRIYALIRLGITDSIKIAEFLHCSPQTIYNNRFKVRGKAIVDKKDFAERVRRLGGYRHSEA